MQRWSLCLVLGLGLLAIGCGDDDSSSGTGSTKNSNGGTSGTSGGKAGSGTGATGSGSSGSGSGSSGSGSSGSGSSGNNVSAAEAVIGACTMMSAMGTSASQCKGIADFEKCAETTCGLQECLNNECKDYLSCVQKASDACNSNCMASSACTNCEASKGSCLSSMCFSKLMCGTTAKGGSCDQLDTCCGKQTNAQLKSACTMGASAARAAGGDSLCMTLLSTLCTTAGSGGSGK
jgi:hypothetical protein